MEDERFWVRPAWVWFRLGVRAGKNPEQRREGA